MTKLKDIAAVAGVSISTVSKALNNSREINKDTKANIIRIARELNYNMTSVHKESQEDNSLTIGVICPEINSNYYAQLISTIGKRLSRKNYRSFIAISDFDRKKEAEYLRYFGSQNFAGIIFITESRDIQGLIDNARELWHKPLVLIASEDEVNDFDCIHIDDQYGVITGVEYLLSLNHKKIAYIGDRLTSGRLAAYRQTLAKHSLPVNEALIRIADKRFEIGGYQSMLSLLENKERPSAVFAAYDDMAIGAMRAITEAGLNIPKDISIVGMDDIFVSLYLCRSLTCISNPIREMAMVSISILLHKIEDPEFTVVQNVVLKPTLAIRETTAEYKG